MILNSSLLLKLLLLFVGEQQLGVRFVHSQCWDGQPHIGNCMYGGLCPPRYTCSQGNICCSAEGSHPVCPDGGHATRNTCDTFNNPCGVGDFCLQYRGNSFCCPTAPSTQAKCPDGWPVRGQCSNNGQCAQGMVCHLNMHCCPGYGIQCPDANAEYLPCGKACESSCDTRLVNNVVQQPCQPLSTNCIPGCYCKQGFAKLSQRPDSPCVLETNCPIFNPRMVQQRLAYFNRKAN